MNRKVLVATVVSLAFSAAANAGTISGKVSGVSTESVVYIEAITGKTFPASTAHAQMDQKALLFQPSVLVVQQGTTVDFQNSDTVAHNVAWSSVGSNKRLAHNMGTWPKGEKRSFKFDNPGAVPLMCYVHPEMEATIIVSPTPYFAHTDKSGSYTIENVPDGTYTLTVWNVGAKGQSKPVTVSGNSTADFTLTKLIR